MPDRRTFLKQATGGAALAALGASKPSAPASSDVHLAVNQYTWFSYYRRAGRDFMADLDAGLAAVAAAGYDGFEPSLETVADVDRLVPLLEKHGLAMHSVYVNSALHEAEGVEAELARVRALAERAGEAGARIVVTNPSPIRWGGSENKTDAQLAVQAAALGRLGAALAERGLTLAYHVHDAEFREGAREFHHMLLANDPAHVTFCLDFHWVYRGAGDSNVALFDVIQLYGDRVTELHLRQSDGGPWTETFGKGDIPYDEAARALAARGVRPHLVMEQAVEEGTPDTMGIAEALTRSAAYAREVFG